MKASNSNTRLSVNKSVISKFNNSKSSNATGSVSVSWNATGSVSVSW